MTEYTGKPIAELTTAEKLEILAAHVVRMPHQPPHEVKKGLFAFNMAWYAETEEFRNGHPCGSICCIGGEALRIFNPELFQTCVREDSGFMYGAQELLGITHVEAFELFGGHFARDDDGRVAMEEITPAQAADAILELAGKYKVATTLEAAAVTEELNK